MQRNRFLTDMLSTLFDRRIAWSKEDDARDIQQLCHALLSKEGDVSGQKLATSILAQYRDLSEDEKLTFFQFLNTELDVDAAGLGALAKVYEQSPSTDIFEKLSIAAEPKRQELLRRLNQPVGATADLVSMRVDLLKLAKTHKDLARTNIDFVHLLRSWFNRGFLVLKQINWDTPARVLDKIVAYEAVHEIDDLDDLRRRLDPADRRCFAFFHPAMPDEPLIFVEVALTEQVPGSIDDVLSEGREPLHPEDAKVAVYYSISNCQRGLAGISFGNLLIKQVAAELAMEFPQIDRFVTLSPIPSLNRWLASQTDDDELGAASAAVLAGTAPDEDVRALAARYLTTSKRGDSDQPNDPVARFHLGNGAEIHDVHANADSSVNGRAQSSGAMVNYLYDLSQTEKNHENFARNGVVAASRAVQSLATAAILTKPEETTS